ncbi:hypothetical protein [Methylocystis parvus]|uniref:hypothetical protein n=1 Tax=Methylocystis parvus TaxID=134 RepID=UPI003C769C34
MPLDVRGAAYARESDEVQVALVTLSHASLSEPLRFSSDSADRLSIEPLRYGTRSRGLEFVFALKGAIVPDDKKETPPRAALVFDNTGADMVTALRGLETRATVKIELVLASSPDVVFQAFNWLRVIHAGYDAQSVTLDLSFDDYASRQFGRKATKQRFPGLFGIPNA